MVRLIVPIDCFLFLFSGSDKIRRVENDLVQKKVECAACQDRLGFDRSVALALELQTLLRGVEHSQSGWLGLADVLI